MIELPFHFIFVPEQAGEKIINSYNEILDKKELDFDCLKAIFIEVTGKEFEEGLKIVSPLVSRKIDKITIEIHLFNDPNDETIAAYYPYLSNPEGNFSEPYFSISRDTLRASLFLIEYEILSESNILTWTHEIIHLVDSSLKQHNEEHIIKQINCPGTRFLHLMFSYRKEGIAGLFEKLTIGNYIPSMESARNEFLKEANKALKQFVTTHATISTLRKKTLYKIGPWMILHVLSCPEYPKHLSGIEKIFLRLKNEERFEQPELISLLRSALEIDNYNFLKYLTKPGIDGQPFITPDQMRAIRKKMGKIPNSREDIKYYMKIKPEESGSIISIIEFYNWFGSGK